MFIEIQLFCLLLMVKFWVVWEVCFEYLIYKFLEKISPIL